MAVTGNSENQPISAQSPMLAFATYDTPKLQHPQPMLAFATYDTPKLQHPQPMLAFATYDTPKLQHPQPMLAFATYVSREYVDLQLLNMSATINKMGNTYQIQVQWELGELDHAIITLKKAPTTGNNYVKWDNVEVSKSITTGSGDLRTIFDNTEKGYKYLIEGFGVKDDGSESNHNTAPKLEIYVATYDDKPEPDPSFTETQITDLSATIVEQNKQKGITVSWNLNGLSYANIVVKQAPSKGYSYVDWATIEGTEYGGNAGKTSMTITPLVEGYVYQVVAVGVDSEGKKSNPDNNPQLAIFISETTTTPTDPDKPNPSPDSPGGPTDTDNPATTFDRITGEQFIERYAIRQRISDAIETGYTDEELLAYINDAINMVWSVMIQMDYDEVAGYLTMTERKIEIPKDYWAPSGKPPVQRYNHMLYCYGDLPCSFRYWMRPKFLRTLQDTLPQGTAWFNPALINLVAQIVIVLAMQNHGFDMGAENDFATSIAKLLPK